MESFGLYLLKSVIWLTGFTLVYFLFLQNERFFRLKRYYLVAGIIISFVFPLFTFHYQVEIPAPPENIIDLNPAGGVSASSIQTVLSKKEFDLGYILLPGYLLGMLFLVFRSVKHFRILIGTINSSKVKNLSRARLVRVPGFSGSFSFFNYVFINPAVEELEMGIIMDHELVHVRQKHWLDLLLAELIRLLQWVNPFAWLYAGFIKQNHEYIADEEVLRHTPDHALYRAVLVNQLFDAQVISLSNSFNYSINKKRFDMMKKVVLSPYRKLKIFLVLPVFAVVFYAFAKPEYHYAESSVREIETPRNIQASGEVPNGVIEITTQSEEPPASMPGLQVPLSGQKEVKGIVLDVEGKPLAGVDITTTGTAGNATWITTGPDGRFSFPNIQDDATIFFSLRGYKRLTLKADFSKEMSVKMEVDPEFRKQVQQAGPYVVIDGEASEKKYQEAIRELGYDLAIIKNISGSEATDKYGEKGAMGVIEITTRKKAQELGLKPEYFPRLEPDDYPTFQGARWHSFRNWVISQVRYPSEAQEKNIEGFVTINYTVELDGTISNPKPLGSSDPVLSREVIRVIMAAPKWDPPKNSAVDMPFNSGVNVGFKLPDQVMEEEPFVVVEEMPMYPGGEGELLKFITENTQYPEEIKQQQIGGKVIVRFYVDTDGETRGLSVLKGVHPLLDAEALRVVDLLTGFNPGKQGGKAVPVWYMVPVNFILP